MRAYRPEAEARDDEKRAHLTPWGRVRARPPGCLLATASNSIGNDYERNAF